MVSALEARISTTAGTKPSLIKESFLVRFPMIRFLSSLRALSWTSLSDEVSRAWRSEWVRLVAVVVEEADAEGDGDGDGEAEAEVGIVSPRLQGSHVIASERASERSPQEEL